MDGKRIYDAARIAADAAGKAVEEFGDEQDDPITNVRGVLVLAAVANEVGHGTSKEKLLSMIETMYDAVSAEPLPPPRPLSYKN